MNELVIEKENYQEPLSEKVRRTWNNLKAWKTGRALRDLHNAMDKDPDLAHGWQCNIAMPIFDGAKGKLTIEQSNEIATSLMHHLFNIKYKNPYEDVDK